VATISELEFERVVNGIIQDRDVIIRHNPIGTPADTLLWMLMSCLISYLNITDSDSPCVPGRPDAETYREAIRVILRSRKSPDFDPESYLDKLSIE
jgi:hypothetical protein